jgi:hypothetical protein
MGRKGAHHKKIFDVSILVSTLFDSERCSDGERDALREKIGEEIRLIHKKNPAQTDEEIITVARDRLSTLRIFLRARVKRYQGQVFYKKRIVSRKSCSRVSLTHGFRPKDRGPSRFRICDECGGIIYRDPNRTLLLEYKDKTYLYQIGIDRCGKCGKEYPSDRDKAQMSYTEKTFHEEVDHEEMELIKRIGRRAATSPQKVDPASAEASS